MHAALKEVMQIQVDPLEVVGRSHDLALCSRVDGFRPALLDEALYGRRTLFEWGGSLQIRPMEELPYFLRKMEEAGRHKRWALFSNSHQALLDRVLKEVERRGPIGSRDLSEGKAVESYRARKDTGLALYYLWTVGRLMIHSRQRSERRYDLTERLAPQKLLREADPVEATEHLASRAIHAWGLPDQGEMGAVLRGASTKSPNRAAVKSWITERERQGGIIPVEVEGWRGKHWVDPEGLDELETLRRGGLPKGWEPLALSTDEEATFLAPLEIVSARGRSRKLFGFEYLWEVYKPASKRRWGYYTLPILHGDRLRARADLRHERTSGTLRVLGFWLERPEDSADPLFPCALGKGLGRLRAMTGACRVDFQILRPARFRSRVSSAIGRTPSPGSRTRLSTATRGRTQVDCGP